MIIIIICWTTNLGHVILSLIKSSSRGVVALHLCVTVAMAVGGVAVRVCPLRVGGKGVGLAPLPRSQRGGPALTRRCHGDPGVDGDEVVPGSNPHSGPLLAADYDLVTETIKPCQ